MPNHYFDQLAQSLTPQVPTEGPMQNVPGVQPMEPLEGTGGKPNEQQANTPANTKLGWPDALIGLSNFLAATRRNRQMPAAPSLAGIGNPAPQGNVGQGPRGRTAAPAAALSQFL